MKSNKNSETCVQRDVKKMIEKGILDGIFPCAAVGISQGVGKDKKTIITYCGNSVINPEKRELKKNDFFDLASLTKPLATTMAVLCLLKTGKVDLEEKLPSLFDSKIRDGKKEITMRQLLSHSSGLPAHREYFTLLRNVDADKKKEILDGLLLKEKLEYKPGSASLYSDLGFMILGRIIEKKAGCDLASFVRKKVLKPLNLEKNIFFNPLSKIPKNPCKEKDFVATENCPWRRKTLCGEVHDDNCYAMGGVAGHSGLFGNIKGVTTLVGAILDIWKGEATHPHINPKDLAIFLKRQRKISGSSWALGFDTPSGSGSSSGRFFSKKSIGHLGFTGTSFWVDPQRDVAVVLLSNRVHPSRENTQIKLFRPYFYDRVMEKIFPAIGA